MKKKYMIIIQCIGGFLSGLLSAFTYVLSRNNPMFSLSLLIILIPLLIIGKYINKKLKQKGDLTD